MTRMLGSLLVFLLIFNVLSCSSTNSDGDSEASDVDTESVSASSESGDDILDAEDELLDESDDLADLSDEEFSEAIEDGDEEEDISDNLDQEFEAAEIESPEEDEFSATDEQQIDPQLADDEFREFSQGEDGNQEADNFIADAEPMEEAPLVSEPVMDDVVFSSSGMNKITNLEYKSFENGGTVVIETQEPTSYRKIVDSDKNQVIIQVNGAALPERFKRPYITKDFKQDVAAINGYSDEMGNARFVIQMKRPVDPAIQKVDNSILVMTSGQSVVSVGPQEESLNALVEENQIRVSSQTLRSSTPSPSAKARSSFVSSRDKKSGLSLSEGTYIGSPISIEFIDEDIRTIIEVIADKGGINIIMDKEVEGKTSISLRNLPWDQALQALLKSEGLGYVKDGSVLRIARQDTLSKEAQAVSAQIKSEKEAKLLASGIKVKYIPVSYAKVSELAAKLKDFISSEGRIAFDDRTSSLVITDFGEYIGRIEELVKALDTPPMQVEIASKLVEAREDFLREAGINWGTAGQPFDVNSQSATVNSSFAGTQSANGLTLDLSIGTFDIFGDLTASLSIFERQNKVKVLSQPRVVTMNKVPAVIEQTTQIPIEQTTVTNGVAQTQFQFLDLILSLNVTPQITFKGDVILDVELKREFAGTEAGDGTREINKRRAKTTVMVKNGKTAVIGGIYQIDNTNIDTGIPGLKDIPLLGYLFKQTSEEKAKNELLLFLKPKILKEVDGPMISKMEATSDPADPFEELSVDEGREDPFSDSFGSEGESSLNESDEETLEEDFSSLEEDSFGVEESSLEL